MDLIDHGKGFQKIHFAFPVIQDFLQIVDPVADRIFMQKHGGSGPFIIRAVFDEAAQGDKKLGMIFLVIFYQRRDGFLIILLNRRMSLDGYQQPHHAQIAVGCGLAKVS